MDRYGVVLNRFSLSLSLSRSRALSRSPSIPLSLHLSLFTLIRIVADLVVNFLTTLFQPTTVCRPSDISPTSKGSVTGAAFLSMTDECGVTARPKRFRGETKALLLLPVTVKSALAVTAFCLSAVVCH